MDGHRIRSAALGNERSVWISSPSNPAKGAHLIVFLDAELYRDKVGAPTIVDQLRVAGYLADAWVVYVSYESVDARWKECPCYPPFVSFVVDELLPWLGAAAPQVRACSLRTLVGLSYTGLAAAFVAHERSGVFHRVIAQSASFWWNDGWFIQRVATHPMSRQTTFWLEVGTRETQTNLQHREGVFQGISQIEGVRQFHDVLVKQGCEVRYVESPDGAHDGPSWSKTLPAALLWASASQSDTVN